MLNSHLNLEEVRDHVRAGMEPMEKAWSPDELSRFLTARRKLYAQVDRSLRSGDGLFDFIRMGSGWLGAMRRPKDMPPEFEQKEIAPQFMFLPSPVPFPRYYQEYIDRLMAIGMGGPLFHWLCKENAPVSKVEDIANELLFNAAERPKNFLGFEALVSTRGFICATHQSGDFNVHAKYEEQMQKPPDKDPLGREIKRPRYWFDLGNGAGYIRGNGLWNFSEDSNIQVNSQYYPERDQTAVFLFKEAVRVGAKP